MNKEKTYLEDLHFMFDEILSPVAMDTLEQWYNFVEQLVRDLNFDFDLSYKALDILHEIGKYVVESRKLHLDKNIRDGEKI